MRYWRDTADAGWARYAEALLVCSGALLLTALINSTVSAGYYYLALGAVVVVALRGGLGPALLTTAVGALGVSWVLPPNYTFRVEGPEAWERLFLFLAVAVTTAFLGASRRKAMLREGASRRRAERYVADLETERSIRERFVMALSHDLRTPLAAARMNIQLGLRRRGDDELAEVFFRRSLGNIDRTLGMIGDLLDSYRIVAGERIPLSVEKVSLAGVVGSVLQELGAVLEVPLVAQVDPEIEGYWDRGFLRRIVENLCVNASKYGEPGAPVVVAARAMGEQVRLTVHNSGPPIPAEVLPLLFRQLYRGPTSEGSRGWGVGLMAVRALAEAHGGSVAVQSLAGAGTTFIVDVPLDARPYQRRQPPPPDVGVPVQ